VFFFDNFASAADLAAHDVKRRVFLLHYLRCWKWLSLLIPHY